MHQHFITCRLIELKTANPPNLNSSQALPSHFDTLLILSSKKLFPEVYVELLNNLENNEDKVFLSKKFLKIYLYAASKIKNDKKLYNWLLKGSLPQSTSQGADSMSVLTQSAKKISSIGKSRNKTIDKVTSNRKKLTEKSSKILLDSLNKNQEKLVGIEAQYNSQKSVIEEIILEIESSLASGRKL